MLRRTSLAARFFVLVFGFSAAWFTLTTSVQLVAEYGNTRREVDANMEDLVTATRAGLETALWSFDLRVVRSSLEAMSTVKFLSGAVVRDEKGGVVASWGLGAPAGNSVENVLEWGQPLYHQFSLSYLDRGKRTTLGSLVLVSGLDVVTARLGESFRIIVSNYAATLAGFLVIFLVGLRRLVAARLSKVTKAIEAYRFEEGTLPPLALGRPDELAVLWTSFESLTAKLKESWLQQRVLSSILEEAAVMALVCDSDGRVVSCNAPARERLGVLPGAPLGSLVYAGSSVPLLADVPDLLTAGEAWRGQFEVGKEERFWLSAALIPLVVPDEPRARWGVMIEDVSAQKLTEHYRRERDLAQESARSKSLFLANISHEIRTPMNAVVGLTALALAEPSLEKVRSYLAPLERSARALLGTINDILDFSKLEEGKVELELVEFALDGLLADVEAMVRFHAEEKGLAFAVKSPDRPLWLKGDPLRLRQILLNLASNAVKFTEKGTVTLSARAAESGWRFEVADTGIGIADTDRGRLFQSFSQVDTSTTRLYGGTGLGLSIVRQLVALMNGKVGFDSRVGEGTVFWAELPLESVSEPSGPGLDLKGLRVLLAEDNKVNQLVAKEILGKVGIFPVVAANGRQAVEAVRGQEFDLILMDLQMPLVDGLEAARQIRAFRPEGLPIIAMTAHAYAQERTACLEAGMQDLVPKPVDADVLYAALRRWAPGLSAAPGRDEAEPARGGPS